MFIILYKYYLFIITYKFLVSVSPKDFLTR